MQGSEPKPEAVVRRDPKTAGNTSKKQHKEERPARTKTILRFEESDVAVDLSALDEAAQTASILTAHKSAISAAFAQAVGIGRRKKLSTCERCGVELSVREMKAHTAAKCAEYQALQSVAP